MQPAEIRAKIEEISDELPKLPAVVTKLLRIIDNDDVSASQVVRLLEPDPSFTTRILRVANSSYYGFAQSIHDLKRAVPLIGLDMVRSLALSMGILKGFASGISSTGFCLDDLWLHSLMVGNGCNSLARKLGFRSEHIFITGFLHDIGKLVLDRFFEAEFRACRDEALKRGVTVHEMEREIVGTDHGEIGAILLEKWQFPAIIVEPVRYHHAPRSAQKASKRDLALIRILDGLCHAMGMRPEPEEVHMPIYGRDLEILGMDEQSLKEFSLELKTTLEKNRAMYSAMA